MDENEFSAHVRAALEDVPPELARALQNIAIVVEDESPESPDILGMFFGYPHADRTPPGALPARVVIYKRPLEESFSDPTELERQIRITVLHELAHYFGIDEDRIADLGYR